MLKMLHPTMNPTLSQSPWPLYPDKLRTGDEYSLGTKHSPHAFFESTVSPKSTVHPGRYKRRVNEIYAVWHCYRFKGTMSAVGHAQWSPVETNLHITRSGIFVFSPLRSSCDRIFSRTDIGLTCFSPGFLAILSAVLAALHL